MTAVSDSVNMASAIITWNKLVVGRAYTGWPDHIIIVDVIVVNSCVSHQVKSSTSTYLTINHVKNLPQPVKL